MNLGVSIIICCYNSALRLPETLKHIALQQSNVKFEVVIVNNNSDDNTEYIASSVWHNLRADIPFKVVRESIPGLSAARIKGVNSAQYDYLIYCDDDNWLSSNYVMNVFDLFENDPTIGIIGGSGSPETEGIPPFWFKKFLSSYAAFPQSDKSMFMDGVFGAGMAIRKKCYTSILEKQFESLLSGRKGKALSAGEDSELCHQVRLIGYKIWYDERLTFKHFIPQSRLDWEYLKNLHIGFAKSTLVLNLYETALKEQSSMISSIYWLQKAVYFLGIYIKYWPSQYGKYKNGVGTIEEINHITWGVTSFEYFKYNFKTVRYYNRIISFRKEATSNFTGLSI